MMKAALRFNLALAIAGMVAGTAPAATLVIDEPIPFGVGETLTGSGSLPNGWVELFIANESQGSVQADPSGNFTFTGIDMTTGQEAYVAQSRVWNFNTPGDTEGWSTTNANSSVAASGGDLVFTQDVVGATGINVGSLGLDPTVYRVWEISFRNNTAEQNFDFRFRGTNAFDGTNVLGFVGMPTATGSNYEIAKLNPDYDFASAITTYQSQTGGLIQSVRMDFRDDLGIGDQIFIDYIRVRENYAYEFNNDGDTEMLNFLNINTPAVAGGTMDFSLSAANPNINKQTSPPDKSRLDASYFTHARARGSQVDQDAGNPQDRWNIYFDAGSGFGGNNISMENVSNGNLGLPMDGTTFEVVADFTSDVDFPATGAIQGLRLDTGTFFEAAGDTVSIDYIRFGPANPYGPSQIYSVSAVPVELDLFMVE